MPRRTGSSQRWRQRQERDIYVEQANRAGWRSRAVFKLEQIQAKERLLKPRHGLRGSRRGARELEPARGPARRLRPVASIAVDLLPMEPIPGVDFLRGRLHGAARRCRRCVTSSATSPSIL